MGDFLLEAGLRIEGFDEAQIAQIEAIIPDVTKAIDLFNQAKPLIAEADALYAKAKPIIAEAIVLIDKTSPTIKMVVGVLQKKT